MAKQKPETEPKKTSCPITREQFAADAKPLVVTLDGIRLMGSPKDFSTGSFGWNVNEKTTIQVGGTLVKVQVGLNVTVVGSKELPK